MTHVKNPKSLWSDGLILLTVLPIFSTFTHQLKEENNREDNIYFSDLLSLSREGIAKAELIEFHVAKAKT